MCEFTFGEMAWAPYMLVITLVALRAWASRLTSPHLSPFICKKINKRLKNNTICPVYFPGLL